MREVVIVQEHLPAFRVPFYEGLRAWLEKREIRLRVVFAPNARNTFVSGVLSWGEPVCLQRFGPLAWQPVFSQCGGAGLVIVQQELKYLLNPVLFLWRRCGGPKVAFWGHGKNFQRSREGVFKRGARAFLARCPDWWFAYTHSSARVVLSYGYPSERVTVVGNTLDVEGLQSGLSRLPSEIVVEARRTYGISSSRVGLFCGGLYSHKRVDFLLRAALHIRELLPDFELVVLGDGPEAGKVSLAASMYPWIHFVGPLGDLDRLPLWALSSVLLMPGLVGLVVVDSFALGVPLVTTDFLGHSPEIDYLKHGLNGVLVSCGEDAFQYAEVVASLLNSPGRLRLLREGALVSASDHLMKDMVSRFGEGVLRALAS